MTVKNHLRKIRSYFFTYFPEGQLKNWFYCAYNNNLKENNFRVIYKREYFIVQLDDSTSIKLKDYRGIDFFRGLLKGYLKNYTLSNGDIVIDGGAYLGEFTLYASQKVGKEGKVIAFEPDRLNFEKLKENIELNKLNNVIAINKGLWDENTILKFYQSSTDGSSFNPDDSSENKNLFIEIPVVKLDSEIDRLGLKRVNFIKMDIEGAEVKAIKGCENILKNTSVNLAIASYHIVDGSQTYADVEKLLKSYGYECQTSFPSHLTTYASKR
ncbi:MAG: FkbM family methyltransferase [Methanosarcina sp.]|uniref:FkbM family methyltransferase n=1 Tax=Methanosarcina sp. TaxID=2213 RepID=UPI00261E9883|nr:FkbM family methyltransferase [Methanosarcina sp.]MDD3245967.1 FkbM family methyltransferase [Methanosarcina sp.]MDD4247603.1 FkbM family methyltransferase [Methanosarcina sp.]